MKCEMESPHIYGICSSSPVNLLTRQDQWAIKDPNKVWQPLYGILEVDFFTVLL